MGLEEGWVGRKRLRNASVQTQMARIVFGFGMRCVVAPLLFLVCAHQMLIQFSALEPRHVTLCCAWNE